jgi:hypothetical protein
MRWNRVLSRGDGNNVYSDSRQRKGKSERNINSIFSVSMSCWTQVEGCLHLLDILPHPEQTMGAHQWVSFVWLYSIAATWTRISIQKGWYSNFVYVSFSWICHYVLNRLLFSSSSQSVFITVAIAEINVNSLWKFNVKWVGIRWQYAIKSIECLQKTETHTRS